MSDEETTSSPLTQFREFFETNFAQIHTSPYISYTIDTPAFRVYLGIGYVLAPLLGVISIIFGIYPTVIFPLPIFGLFCLAFFSVLSYSLYYERYIAD